MDSVKVIKFHHQLLDNLNIVYNVSSRSIVFWNKYQIFLFDELKYESLDKVCQWIHFTEFRTAQVILSVNYLICLDYNGFIYVSPLKFKQSAQKRIKSSFQLRVQGILCIEYNENNNVTFSIQKEATKLYFCIHKISSEFPLEKKIQISNENIQCASNFIRGKMIFTSRLLSEIDFIHIKDLFQLKDVQWTSQLLVIVSFDNLTLYAFLICMKSTQEIVSPIKLHTYPSQINNISFIYENHLSIIISLASGTLIKQPLTSEYKKGSNIIHLNTAINKCLALNSTMIYTDGITMWKSENTYSESSITFREFVVRHVKDFIKVADQIVCVTYSKLIYLMPLEEEACYLKQPATDGGYCPVDDLLNNCDYLDKIMEEIKKNDQIIKNIKKEENYLMTLALSNRKDIMDEVINYKVTILDNYEDILNEEIPLTMTNNLGEYFHTNTLYFLIRITTSFHLQQKFCDILSNLFGNLKIHITLSSENKVLKTTSITVQEQLKMMNIVIPLNTQMLNLTKITLHIQLVTHIPGALNEKDSLWTNLHSDKIVLNPENFIKTNTLRRNIQFIKEPKKSIIDLIYETAYKHYGKLFKINRVSNSRTAFKWSFYVKLPNSYQDALKNRNFIFEKFHISKAKYLLNELSSEEFLKSRSNLCFIIDNERVELEILNDGLFDPLLKVTSQNALVALGIRNFLSILAHNNFENNDHVFISNTVYDSIENMERKLKMCLLKNTTNEEFINIFDQYQRNIIGALVL
ncbi:uncharacterized protein LOC124540064 [Vanessa cardui]|uniref:uncharacterized protein LOC124540064 n=1 Tax=Vanessa cardui TaxID=171605 RepID=UPI001F146AC0|nr:uncharacterized protein LOC124540064 [Vanessa cardui]